ncbi:MAG: galactokinase [Phycisphaerales bacterium]
MARQQVSASGESVDAACAERAAALHRARFGAAPETQGAASGRVNLIGDHVDYAGGPVLPMAIAARTHVAMARAAHDAFASAWEIDPQWTRYAAGVLAELRASGVAVPPVSVAVASDVPVGAGLSSSAALEVAVARAALALTGVAMPPRDIALLCQRAEHVHAGTPCGIMDQWCVAHAARGEAILLDCATLSWRAVALPRGLAIEIVDSGVRHALRDGGYASRRADVEEAARLLGVRLLAELPPARRGEIDLLPARLARRARHVVAECARVHAAVDALQAGDLARFGRLLVESHASLRDDFDVSTPELDAIVARACDGGALGARMTGGGFGGSVVVARAAG